MEEEIEQPEPLHTFVDPSFPEPLDVQENPISEAAYEKKTRGINANDTHN